MELHDTLKKNSNTIAHFIENSPNAKTVRLFIHGHAIKSLLKHDLSTEESCSALLTQKEPEELARIITAADFLEMPALLAASLNAFKARLQSKEWCFFYNAHPEKIAPLVDSLTPPMQQHLESLFWSYTDFKNAECPTTKKIFSRQPYGLVRQEDTVLILGKNGSLEAKNPLQRIALQNGHSEKIAWHPMGKGERLVYNDAGTLYAASTYSDNTNLTVRVCASSEERCATFLKNLPPKMDGFAFTGPEDSIVICSPQALGLWNCKTGNQICSVHLMNNSSLPHCLASHQKSSVIALSLAQKDFIHWYISSPEGLKLTQSSEFDERIPSALAFNKEGTILAIGYYDETISLICATKKTILTTLLLDYAPHRICFSLKNSLCIIPKKSGRIHLIVPEKLPLLRRIATTIQTTLPRSAVSKIVQNLAKE